ncbi:MAG TPA: M1 family metallopeptidase, partial [Chitinophagaceae bacterium]
MFLPRVCVLFFSCLVSLLIAGQTDITHYRFELTLSDNTDSIYGKATISARFLQASDDLWINLRPVDAKGKGMRVTRATAGGHTLQTSVSKDTIYMHLPATAKTGDSVRVIIEYAGIPDDGLIISKNKYGERTFFADNWPNRAHHWIPCKDEPGDKATFEFIVTAPAEYTVVSNGKLVDVQPAGNLKMTHWAEDVSLPTKVMVIGVARFAVTKYDSSVAGVPVSAWTYPQDSATGARNYAFAPGILSFFEQYIGPYPYNKLANVQSKTIFGGMENASAIFYYEESAELHQSMEDLLAHEIAHQWFGDMVSEKSFPNLWLSEGFATYLTDVYLESRYGTDSLNRRLSDERKTVIQFDKRAKTPVVDSVSSLMELLNANSYQKGAWTLHMLRLTVGDSAFHDIIRKFYAEYKGSNANTTDFERVAEKVSGKDLRQFFTQWLYTPEV